jgi:hypothetical protein
MLSSLLSWWMLRVGIEYLEKDDIDRVTKTLRVCTRVPPARKFTICMRAARKV